MFRKLLVCGALVATLASCDSGTASTDELGFARTDVARAQTVRDCSTYPSQAAAQAALRDDPSDPNNLDEDDDGIACENNPAPFDRTPVNRQIAAATTLASGAPTTTEPATTVTRSTDEFADTGPRDWLGITTLAAVVVFAVGVALRGRRARGIHWID